MLMLRFVLFLVLHVLPVQINCYTGDLHHLSPWYSFLNICRTKFARTEYLHIPFTAKDRIHGLWIFQQKSGFNPFSHIYGAKLLRKYMPT